MPNECQCQIIVLFYLPATRCFVFFFCPVLPSSGILNEVKQSGAEEGVETREKKWRKGNSNALPGNATQPATTSPHDISERKTRQFLLFQHRRRFHLNALYRHPERPKMPHSRLVAISHPRMRSIAFFRAFRNASEVNARVLRHQLQTLRSRKLSLPYSKNDIIGITLKVRWFGWRKTAWAAVTNILVALLQRETYRPGSRQS